VPSIDVTTDDRASVRVWADELGADAQVTDLASVIAPFRLAGHRGDARDHRERRFGVVGPATGSVSGHI
jgi:hypothetical protein